MFRNAALCTVSSLLIFFTNLDRATLAREGMYACAVSVGVYIYLASIRLLYQTTVVSEGVAESDIRSE